MILIVVTFILVGYYLFYLYLFYKSLILSPKPEISYKKHSVSVIIAARNEEKNIGFLLTSLINQSYPLELYEIIVADDGSDDKTAQIINEFSQKHKNIKIINVTNRKEVISPKKNALQQAINQAQNDIIVSTDADCIPGRFWLEAMMMNFLDQVDMVTGFSQTSIEWNDSSLVQKFEHVDFLNLFFAAAGAIQSDKYFSCSGQNIAYRKNVFKEIGGFEKIKHLVSGDDVNLMQLFKKNNKKIVFSFYPESFMKTKPVNSWKDLLNQRTRWASNTKWQFQLNIEFFFYLFSVFGTVLLPILLLFFHLKIGITLLLLRFCFEFFYVKKAAKLFLIKSNRLSFFPIWFILQPLYLIAVAVGGQLNLFRWKK